jgi:hypothetical protein
MGLRKLRHKYVTLETGKWRPVTAGIPNAFKAMDRFSEWHQIYKHGGS